MEYIPPYLEVKRSLSTNWLTEATANISYYEYYTSYPLVKNDLNYVRDEAPSFCLRFLHSIKNMNSDKVRHFLNNKTFHLHSKKALL